MTPISANMLQVPVGHSRFSQARAQSVVWQVHLLRATKCLKLRASLRGHIRELSPGSPETVLALPNVDKSPGSHGLTGGSPKERKSVTHRKRNKYHQGSFFLC